MAAGLAPPPTLPSLAADYSTFIFPSAVQGYIDKLYRLRLENHNCSSASYVPEKLVVETAALYKGVCLTAT